MNYPTHESIRELLDTTSGTCISLYMPAHPVPAASLREDALRFKNLLREAAGQLSADDQPVLGPALAEAGRLEADADFWRHQSKGLAVFMGPSGLQVFNLPVPVQESVHVDDRFYVTPLIDCATQYKTLYVLAISRGGARLLKSDHEGLHQLAVHHMPGSEADANKFVETEKLLQNRTPAGPAGSYHGEGADTHEPHARTREYLLQIDDAVTDRMGQRPLPLVVAASEPTLGLYCKLTHHKNIAGRLDLDPDGLSLEALHEKAWAVGAAAFEDPAIQARNAFGSFSVNEPDRIETDPDRITAAAQTGRVGTLLVARPQATADSGGFHERIPAPEEAASYVPDGAVEAAVQATYLTGGTVVQVGESQLPNSVVVAAVMRY